MMLLPSALANPALHLILRVYVCMYVCMSVTLRNANFLYAACAGSMARACGCTIVVASADHSAQEYNGSVCAMDNRPYQG